MIININNTATGVVCLCKNNQGNLLTCYFPDIIKQTEPLLKDDVIEIAIDASDSGHIKLTITKNHQESIKAAKDCYELYFNNEIISLPFIDSPGFAAVQTALFPFALALCMDKERNSLIRWLAGLTAVACALTITLSGSRAGLLAICAAAAVVLAFKTKVLSLFKTHKWLWIVLIIVAVALSFLLYRVKAGSANGRWILSGQKCPNVHLPGIRSECYPITRR
jgi:uncharacterized membrane protein (UPF0136 family)